jgi:large subunit ribosomal protein L6
MKEDIKEELEIPEKVEVAIDKDTFTVKGEKGECKKKLSNPKITINQKDNKLTLFSKKATKREKKVIYTFIAHLKNMMKGVREKHVYKLKICSGHFPMNVELKGGEFVVKNFFGEKVPRVMQIKDGVDVKVDGSEIIIESPDIELAGQTAANMERLTTIRNRDLRIFQDGIYIVEKHGVPIRKG